MSGALRAAVGVCVIAATTLPACTAPLSTQVGPTAQGFVLSAELANQRQSLYAQLARIDGRIAEQDEAASPDSAEARRRAIARELRDVASFTLAQERVVAARKFDADGQLGEFLSVLYMEAAALLSAADDVLSTPPSPTLSCLTEISAEPAEAAIHYMAYGEFVDQASADWRSYDTGARLDIGLYQFRVSPPDEVPYFERVLIVSDPFRTQLRRAAP